MSKFALKNIFEKTFITSLFTIAIPIMVQNFINASVNMADTAMIGRLGASSVAAVGLGNQIFFLLNMLLFGMVSGSAVFCAQFWGRKDTDGIKRTFGLCLILATLIGGMFTSICLLIPETIIGLYTSDTEVIKLGSIYLSLSALCFMPFSYSFVLTMILRSIEKVKIAVVSALIALSLNLILNFILIFGFLGFPAMGVKGAAAATVISRIVELLIVLSITLKKRYPVFGTPAQMFSLSAKFLAAYFTVTLPVIIEETLWSLGVTVENKIIAGMGTSEYAAFNIVLTVSQLLWVIFMGMGNASGVIIGKKIGAGETEKAKTYAKSIAVLSPLVAVGVMLLFLPISFFLPIMFNVGEEVLKLAPPMMFALASFYPLKAFNSVMIIGICRSGGDTRFSLFYDIFFMWAASIPIAYFFSKTEFAPAWFVFCCILSEEPLKIFLGIKRLKTGKWLRCVINN